MTDSPPESQRQSKPERRSARQLAAKRRAQRQRMMTWGGIAVALAIVLTAVLIYLNRDDSPDTTSIDWNGLTSDGRYLGNADAPVNFVVYSDFQCPVCKQFDQTDLPPVIDNFVESGKVRVEWRPMPIISNMVNVPLDSPDNESVQSAEAAMCAADQDQFWPYSEAMYSAQGAENSGVFSDEMLKQTAADLNLDTATFNDCLDSGEKQDEVLKLRQDGIDSGVQGTPTFLINDQLVNYTRGGYSTLKGQLDDALDGKPVSN